MRRSGRARSTRTPTKHIRRQPTPAARHRRLTRGVRVRPHPRRAGQRPWPRRQGLGLVNVKERKALLGPQGLDLTGSAFWPEWQFAPSDRMTGDGNRTSRSRTLDVGHASGLTASFVTQPQAGMEVALEHPGLEAEPSPITNKRQ